MFYNIDIKNLLYLCIVFKAEKISLGLLLIYFPGEGNPLCLGILKQKNYVSGI